MKLSDFKNTLQSVEQLAFKLPDGQKIPAHFHITEAGLLTKQFMDCGGTVRNEKLVTMQLWSSYDFHHRLKPGKVIKILDKVQPLIGDSDHEIEIEYQSDTIGKYGLSFDGGSFKLTTKQTDCLARDNCDTNMENYSDVMSCNPASGCC